MAIDVSPSMDWATTGGDYNYPDEHEQSRLEIVQNAAKDLIDELFDRGLNVEIAIAAFDEDPISVQELTSDQNTLKNAIDELDDISYRSGTDVSDGLYQAVRELSVAPTQKAIIVLSDGESNDFRKEIRKISQRKSVSLIFRFMALDSLDRTT